MYFHIEHDNVWLIQLTINPSIFLKRKVLWIFLGNKDKIVEYNSKTAPLKNYYTEQGKFHGVKGVGSIEEIFNRITSVIEMYWMIKANF